MLGGLHYIYICWWLFQAHAPNSNVIVVGTFLDQLGEDGRRALAELENRILHKYRPENGFPKIMGIVLVSNSTRENIEDLKFVIYSVVLRKKVKRVFIHTSGGNEHLIGRMVGISYIIHIIL